MTASQPRIFVQVPGIEGFHTVAELLEAAGAHITAGYREFVVAGPLTPNQATATWQLSRYVDGNSDGNQLQVRVEPAGDVGAALQVMCPEGFNRGAWPVTTDRGDTWWAGQQDRQKAKTHWRPAAEGSIPAAADACCGEGGTWAPKGKDFAVACQLCRRSPTYWRRGRVTADGLHEASHA